MLHFFSAGALAFLLSLAVKSTLVLAAAWLAAFAMRGRSAATRHLVWMAAFTAVLAMPALSLALPALESRWAAWLPDAGTLVFQANASGVASSTARATPTGIMSWSSAEAPTAGMNWTLWIVLVWCAGSALLLAQMAFAYLGMALRRRRARAFDAACDLPPGVAVLEAAPGSMPLAFGVLHPVVFLPAGARQWSAERLQMVVRHELAHIERGDAATHLAARAAVSLLWWNPLAWLAWREFLKERERAADDLVLAAGARPSEYAGHLLEIARSMQSQPAAAWAAVAMARRSQLEGRLLSILDGRVSRKSARRASAAAAVAAAVLLTAPLAAVRAQSQEQPLPPDVQATIRAAAAQKNHEILDNAAAAFEKIRSYDTAQRLLASSLEIRAAVAGDQSGEYAAGLVKLGDLESKRRNIGEALAFYKKAVSLGDRPETASALIALGVDAMGHKDLASAMGLFERAAAASNSDNTTGRAYMWMGLTEQTNPDHKVQVEEDYRQAIRTLDPNSSEAATALNLFARFLAKEGRDTEAEPLAKQATATVQKLEGQSRLQSATPKTIIVTGVATKPELIRKLEPSYTEEARAAKLQGVVVLSVTIEPDGTADNMQVVKSLGLGLDEMAMEAVAQWQFKPGTKGGTPVPVLATIEVNFRLL